MRDDGEKCWYCGRPLEPRQRTRDHVEPKSAGGSSVAANLVTCCRACNQLKGSRGLKQFLAEEQDYLEKQQAIWSSTS